ncbi:hypothetical protein CH54_312 [Yersinia rochesterensis]|uniref:Uncharacterized protein n=1 Tax=Yersinia rochesterensis TaxID=1604335 RepID=A0ABN4FBB8_9GAMM|nr:hypothetical protein DJ57_1166 [Yersinia rochesterensis]AJI87429.1 hypothetical protein AW19_1350 [Yersinia frederiksenii Y225]AJJ34889.1 hypothetical protein CH54_312 [Yersinia rochesterensis]CNH32815.1 Uncharacterised protein [Yersinia kristensenii]CRY64043.1 Uncharacterised protein [Yersinia kristensenii]
MRHYFALVFSDYGGFVDQPQFIALGGFNLSAGCVCLWADK